GTSRMLVPRSSIAGPEVAQVELGVIGHGLPDGSSAAEFPPGAGPGFGGLFQRGAFKRLRGIARNGVEAPLEFAGVRIVRGDVAAHAHFRSAVADNHSPFHNAWRAGDRVAVFAVNRECFPNDFAGGGVERDKAPVERPNKDLSLPRGRATIHHVAARV